MIRLSKEDEVDVELYASRLQRDGTILYDRSLMMDQLYFSGQLKDSIYLLSLDVMCNHSAGQYNSFQRNAVYKFLINCEGCNAEDFYKRGVSSFSLNRETLSKLQKKGRAAEFIEYYSMFGSLKTKCGNINSIVHACNRFVATNKYGRELCELSYSVKKQKNLRFNYSNFDLISQIPKEYCKCISVEEGYFLAWGDFAQSDFRIAYNLFLRSKENDKIMLSYEDKYEALARIIAKASNEEFHLEQFKKERPLYKKLTLATIYGTRSSSIQIEKIFIERLTKFLMTCPKYVEYVKRLDQRVDLNLPLCVKSYFGHEEVCHIDPRFKIDAINNALNIPIQSGTSEIVILVVSYVLNTFYAMGYTKNDVDIYFVRHDEPIFKLSERAIKDVWILNQCSEILVDSWIPLALEFDFGYSYTIRDDELCAKIQQVYKEKESKIDKFAIGTEIDQSYFPVEPVFCLMCHYVIVNEVTIVAFYSEGLNAVSYKLLSSNETKVIHENIVNILAEYESSLYQSGYQDMLILNNYFEFDNYSGTTFFKFKKEKSARMDKVITLCKYMVCKYCNKNSLNSPVNPPFQKDAEWVQSVKELEILQG